MDEKAKGLTVALVVVTLAALFVAFGSSAKARSTGNRSAAVKKDLDRLTQTTKSLEENLRGVQEKYNQETVVTADLKEALAQEQLKNQALTEEIQRLKAAQDAKKTGSAAKTDR